MTKNNDSEHSMITRSKNTLKKQSKSSKPQKKIKKNNKLKKTSDDDDSDIDTLKDFISLVSLLQKFQNKNIIDYNYNEEIEDEDEDEDESEKNNIINHQNENERKNDNQNIIDNKSEELIYLENYERKLLSLNETNDIFKHKILKSNLKDDLKRVIIKNINYYNNLNKSSSEYEKMSNWMRSMEKIPFGNFINLPVSYKSCNNKICDFLQNLQYNLNNCIYGQNKAKESILQIVTQIITNPQSKGSIIALKGPPGVGKTSLIKNGLAKALNLPFSFITLGGISDASYFDGFSYTYEGSKYGKICEILMKTGCMNPIIFMDELDKISNTDKGDDINNLLVHLTDFTQNELFEDKYFSGIPLDLSKAIFIFSLNDERLLNPILKDRLNIIHLEEFKIEEKIKIGMDYLIPELIDNIGMKEKIDFTENNIRYIIENYCSTELGVRELKRCIETILRRVNVLKYSKKIKLNYSLEKMTFPLEINNKIINELLQDRKRKSDSTSQLMMYL